MKITSITPYLFSPGKAKNLLLCRVDTDDGFYGWGEGYVMKGMAEIVYEYILKLADLMIGKSPFKIKQTGEALVDSFLSGRNNPNFSSAWSAVEIALWDIVGKATGVPIYNLLGGCSREHIYVYANGWWDGAKSPEEAAENAKKTVDIGFTALKCSPLPRPWHSQLSQREEDYAVAMVAAVREAIGPDVELIVDALRHLTPYHAQKFLYRIAEYDIAWFEEPCPVENLDLLRDRKSGINIPMVAGETMYTKSEFRNLLERRVVEIINPDVCACGGILKTLEIASMAEPYQVILSPHNYNSTGVGLAATCQVAAIVSLFNIAEVFVNLFDVCNEVFINAPRVHNGFVELWDSPGLGVDIDMEAIKRHPPVAWQ